MAGKMLKRSRYGYSVEHAFAALCNEAGAIPQKVSHDEFGWDFIVEFPELDHAGPADEQPAWKTVYVQVKSSETVKPRIPNLTLSNALKMSQKPEPWFIVFYHRQPGVEQRIFVKHVWQDFISCSLKRVRQADLNGKKLNKVNMSIDFSSNDDRGQGIDLIKWIERTVNEIGDDYQSQKENLYKTAGYERGGGIGKITLLSESREQIDRALLGLTSIQVASFEFKPQRFGIVDEARAIVMQKGFVTFSPNKTSTSFIQLRKRGTVETITLSSKMTINPFPNAALVACVEANFVVIIFYNNRNFNINIKLNHQLKNSIQSYVEYLKICNWISSVGLEVSIISDGINIPIGSIEKSGIFNSNWLSVLNALNIWNDNALYEIKVNGQELEKASFDLVSFERSVSSENLIIEGELDHEHAHEAEALIYTTSVQILNNKLTALIEREVTERKTESKRKRISFGKAKIRDIRYLNLDKTQNDITVEELNDIVNRSNKSMLGFHEIIKMASQKEDDFHYCYHSPNKSLEI